MPGYFWDNWLCLAGKLSWVKTITQVNSALHPSKVDKSNIRFGWGKNEKINAARWQVILRDQTWHVLSPYSVAIFDYKLLYLLYFLLYFFVWAADSGSLRSTASLQYWQHRNNQTRDASNSVMSQMLLSIRELYMCS